MHTEAAQADNLARLHRDGCILRDAVLTQLVFNQGKGQPGAIDRRLQFVKDIGGGADMVLMAMGKYKSPHPLLIGNQVTDIGNDQVNPQHIFLGENGAAVHDNNVLTIFKHGDVLSDFINSPKRQDF